MGALANPQRTGGREPRLLEMTAPPQGLLGGRHRRVKRAFDVLLALGLAVVVLPLALAIAAAIRFESPGPVLFAHTRIGKGRRRFRLWKFRSMVVNGDEILNQHLARHPEHAREWTLTHKLRSDPRITRVGRLLRKTSLDELPQLWNVMRGDMSLIGPRPIVEAETAKYGPALSLYTKVRPGLTGLWQVSGRNDISYRKRVALDSEYIARWTLGVDLLILVKTIRVVVFGHGAY